MQLDTSGNRTELVDRIHNAIIGTPLSATIEDQEDEDGVGNQAMDSDEHDAGVDTKIELLSHSNVDPNADDDTNPPKRQKVYLDTVMPLISQYCLVLVFNFSHAFINSSIAKSSCTID